MGWLAAVSRTWLERVVRSDRDLQRLCSIPVEVAEPHRVGPIGIQLEPIIDRRDVLSAEPLDHALPLSKNRRRAPEQYADDQPAEPLMRSSQGPMTYHHLSSLAAVNPVASVTFAVVPGAPRRACDTPRRR